PDLQERFDLRTPASLIEFRHWCELSGECSLSPETKARFGAGELGNELLASGWSYPERGYTWRGGNSSQILFQTPKGLAAGTPLSMRLRPFINARHTSLPPSMTLDRQPLHRVAFTFDLSGESFDGAVVIPEAGHDFVTVTGLLPELSEGEPTLGFDFSLPASPAALELEPDERTLGVALAALEVGRAPAATGEAVEPAPRRSRPARARGRTMTGGGTPPVLEALVLARPA